jgi:hypothetical protein
MLVGLCLLVIAERSIWWRLLVACQLIRRGATKAFCNDVSLRQVGAVHSVATIVHSCYR